MSEPPEQPKVYHITHADNLTGIIRDSALLCDRHMLARGGPEASIGMSRIKRRRLTLPVRCHAGDFVGDYVPFYFCPRSVMLYVIHRGDHPDLGYRGGQDPIVHLEADLAGVVEWAAADGRRWAFTLSNAGVAPEPNLNATARWSAGTGEGPEVVIRVRNAGPGDAEDVDVTLALFDGANGTLLVPGEEAVECPSACAVAIDVAAGESRKLTLTLPKIDGPTPLPGRIVVVVDGTTFSSVSFLTHGLFDGIEAFGGP